MSSAPCATLPGCSFAAMGSAGSWCCLPAPQEVGIPLRPSAPKNEPAMWQHTSCRSLPRLTQKRLNSDNRLRALYHRPPLNSMRPAAEQQQDINNHAQGNKSEIKGEA